MKANVFVYDFVAIGTKIANREERAGNPLGFRGHTLNTIQQNELYALLAFR